MHKLSYLLATNKSLSHEDAHELGKRAAQLELENEGLRTLIKTEFDFGDGEIRHYLKHALLTEEGKC